MLKYDKINISEGIDINKCKETSRECSLCKPNKKLFLLGLNLSFPERFTLHYV